MGFYIRKSISAGPFRFNLSTSGVGMSVGVKGFRVGSGPRGNYVHMGRGGLYYRASLGAGQSKPTETNNSNPIVRPSTTLSSAYIPVQVETGNVLEMKPSDGSDVVAQINEKLSLFRFWPWALGLGAILSVFIAAQPGGQPLATATIVIAAVAAAVLARWDQVRKAVVLMYDLDDHATATFKSFLDEFEKIASASRIWNIDTDQKTDNLKRNAGASRLLSRKSATLTQRTPSVVKTNVSVPAILGGKQNIYFFPDVALVTQGNTVGAISYDQLALYWSTTIFVEEEGVPRDSIVVGHTWKFVNKNGSPDRRFNNNRQIPKVQYQQMELRGTGGFQKILHISNVANRALFDNSLLALAGTIKQSLASAQPR